MKNISFYFSMACLTALVACSGGVGGSSGGGGTVGGGAVGDAGGGSLSALVEGPGNNLAAPLQEPGPATTRFDPGGKAYYRLAVWNDFNQDAAGNLLIKGYLRRIDDKAPDLQGKTLRIVDFRNRKYIDTPVQIDPAHPANPWVEVNFAVPYLPAKELLTTDEKILGFWISTPVGNSHPEQWNKTLDCGSDPKCNTLLWNITYLDLRQSEQVGTPIGLPPAVQKTEEEDSNSMRFDLGIKFEPGN